MTGSPSVTIFSDGGAEGGSVFAYAFTAWTITEGMRDFDESWPSGIEPRDCFFFSLLPESSLAAAMLRSVPIAAAHRRTRRLVDRHDGVEVARVVVRLLAVVGVVDREAAVRRGDLHLDERATNWSSERIACKRMWIHGLSTLLESKPEPERSHCRRIPSQRIRSQRSRSQER